MKFEQFRNNMLISFEQWQYLKNVNEIWKGSNVKQEDKDRVVFIDYYWTTPPRKPTIEEPDGFYGIFDPTKTKVYLPKFLVNNHPVLNMSANVSQLQNKNYKEIDYKEQRMKNFNVSFEPRKEQLAAFEAVKKRFEEENQINGIFKAAPGWGKALPHDEKILRPDNTWYTMGEAKVNDVIVDENLNRQIITEKFYQGKIDIYTIEFCDGSSVRCCKEHLWKVYDKIDKKDKVITLGEILEDYEFQRYSVPLIKSNMIKSETELKMHKIILGVDENDDFISLVKWEKDDKINNSIIEYCRLNGIYCDTTKELLEIHYKIKRKQIIKITKTGKEKASCIKVSGKSKLFVTNDYTVTHNTFFAIKVASNLQLKTMFTVPTGVLHKQWVESILKFSNLTDEKEIGVIHGSDLNSKENLLAMEKDVVVTMIQTLLSIQKNIGYTQMLPYFNQFGLVVYDESHKSGAAESFSKTVPLFTTDNIIGLSATPYRQDINKFLLDNNIGPMLYESDHQNLIPIVNIRRYMLSLGKKELGSLNFLRNDYIKFLAKYNSFLYENDAYIDYIARWVVYRFNEGHDIVVLFTTNKLVSKLKERLEAYNLNNKYVGTLTGKTEKDCKVIKPKITKELIDFIGCHYFSCYPRKKKLPVLVEEKVIGKPLLKTISEINEYLKENGLSSLIFNVPDNIIEESEMETAKKKRVILSNFMYLSDGFDKDTLSNIIFGSPLKGRNTVIQTLGRITRLNPNKIQEVVADFILSDVIVDFFSRIHWDIKTNIQVEYKEAKIILENFEEVFEKEKNKKENKNERPYQPSTPNVPSGYNGHSGEVPMPPKLFK